MSLLDENWNFTVDTFGQERKEYVVFEENLKRLNEHVLKMLDSIVLGSWLDTQVMKKFSNSGVNYDCDLESLIEKNKQLKSELEASSGEMKQRKSHYESYKQDKKILAQEVKDTHEAFLMAKKYYRKYLNIYYAVDSTIDGKQKVFVQFFTEARKTSDNYSVTLLRDINTGSYTLDDMVPRITTFKEIQKKLQETNDVPGALRCIRQSFLKIKQNK